MDIRGVGIKSGFCIHCNAWQGQHGLEPDYKLYLSHCKLWMQEAIRVLRDDGVIFINLADSYNSTPIGRQVDPKRLSANGQYSYEHKKEFQQGCPNKSKLLIPERFAIMMADYDGEDIYEFKEGLTMEERFAIIKEIEKHTGERI